MGLLNHLFGTDKSVAQKLVMDDTKRMELWNEHLANHTVREKLSKQFNFANVDKAVQDFAATDALLKQIEDLISPELVTIAHEKKIEQEIVADLDRLKSNPEIEQLSEEIVSVKQKQAALKVLFHEILYLFSSLAQVC